MAGLLDLPTEVWDMIIREVSIDFLRKDIGRLIVCRKWYFHWQAWLPMLYSDVRLDSEKILNITTQFSPGPAIKYIRRLDLDLYGWPTTFAKDMDAKELVHARREDWASRQDLVLKLNDQLAVFGQALKENTVLRDLRIFAEHETHGDLYPLRGSLVPQRRYISHASLVDILQGRFLTKLELDLQDSGTPKPNCRSFDRDAEPTHLCPYVGALLPRLVSLRLRLTHICPQALQPPEGETVNPALEVLVVSLSLHSWWKFTSFTHARLCGVLEGFYRLHRGMEQELRKIGPRLSAPRKVCMLYHQAHDYLAHDYFGGEPTPPQNRLREYDALTNRRHDRRCIPGEGSTPLEVTWKGLGVARDHALFQEILPEEKGLSYSTCSDSDQRPSEDDEDNYSSCSDLYAMELDPNENDDGDDDSGSDMSLIEENFDGMYEGWDANPSALEEEQLRPIEEVLQDMKEHPADDPEKWGWVSNQDE